jgi:serine/threonine-protein kinase
MTGPHPAYFNSAAPFFTPQRGDVLAGKYRVESTLGSGGMGVVVLVEHIELGQRMAVKLMTPGVNHDPQNITRFLREARAAAGIQSEHVVRIFDVGTFDTGAPYMVMEPCVEGTSVSSSPPWVACPFTRPSLRPRPARSPAHAMGIVHAATSLSNLFLAPQRHGASVLTPGISKR